MSSATHINNIITDYCPAHRFLMNQILDENDYSICEEGYISGYGENPVNVLVRGVSCFDPEPIPNAGHGVVDTRTQLEEPCYMLSSTPRTVKLAQDYEIMLRFRTGKKKQFNVKHYSIFPVDRMSIDEFDRIIHRGQEDCCKWIPCGLKAQFDILSDVDDGCDDSDLERIKDFGVRALYLFAKFVFPRLNFHDRVIINGLLTLLSTTPQGLDSIFEENMALVLMVYRILSAHADLPPTLTNYAGIVLGKMEDLLFPQGDDPTDLSEPAVHSEFIYVVEGSLKGTAASRELEHSLVTTCELELEQSIRRIVRSNYPCSIFVTMGASIYFVIRTRDEHIVLEEQCIKQRFGSLELAIHLKDPLVYPDIELDRFSRGVMLNEEQLEPDSANCIFIGIPMPERPSAVLVPITKQSLARVKLGTDQCYGFRADQGRCENRRRRAEEDTSPNIWCHHHEYQKDMLSKLSQDITVKEVSEKPKWWII